MRKISTKDVRDMRPQFYYKGRVNQNQLVPTQDLKRADVSIYKKNLEVPFSELVKWSFCNFALMDWPLEKAKDKSTTQSRILTRKKRIPDD